MSTVLECEVLQSNGVKVSAALWFLRSSAASAFSTAITAVILVVDGSNDSHAIVQVTQSLRPSSVKNNSISCKSRLSLFLFSAPPPPHHHHQRIRHLLYISLPYSSFRSQLTRFLPHSYWLEVYTQFYNAPRALQVRQS